jgi:hypothetical protein
MLHCCDTGTTKPKKWAAHDVCTAAGLVPWAVNKAQALALARRNVQVVQVGPDQYQCQYYDPGTAAAYVQRSLNIAATRCTCLEYQTYRFPCKDVFAALQATRGDAWITVVKTFYVYVDTCFQLKSNLAIVMETAIAPDMEMLSYMRDSDYAMAMSLENADLGIPVLVPPPLRVKEKLGNSKRNRKRKCRFVMQVVKCNITLPVLSSVCRNTNSASNQTNTKERRRDSESECYTAFLCKMPSCKTAGPSSGPQRWKLSSRNHLCL